MAELLRYAREGEGIMSRFDVDVVELLLDAARMAIEADWSTDDERGQVHAAVAKYLEGWAP